MDKHVVCIVLAVVVLSVPVVLGEDTVAGGTLAEKTEAVPAKVAVEEKAPAMVAVHPIEAKYDDKTNPFIAENWNQYSYGYKLLSIHRFLAFANVHLASPVTPFGRKKTGQAEVDAARERLEENLKQSIHHADYTLRRIKAPADKTKTAEEAAFSESILAKMQPILQDYSVKVIQDVKIVEAYVQEQLKAEKKEEHKPDQLTKQELEAKPGPLNYTKLAAKILGRTYHKLIHIPWNKFEGQALGYTQGSPLWDYITTKPLVAEGENGELLTSLKIQHIRRYVRDDYVVIDMKFGKGGEVTASRAWLKMEGKDPFDTGLIMSAKGEDIILDVYEKTKAHMASFQAQGGRAHFSEVIKLNMEALAGSMER